MVDLEKFENSEGAAKSGCFFGSRHVQYALLFSVNLLAYSIRNILNVAVIAMISTAPPDENVPTYPEWSEKKNVMLSSFFWGYICLQIVAGQIAKNYGPKLFLTGAIFTCSTFSLLIPVLGARYGYEGVIACRIIQGLAQGFVYPSVHNLLSAWVPLVNRAKVASFVYAGSPLGTVIAMPIAGYLSDTTWGWPSAFYLYGVVGYMWCLLWFLIGSNSPQEHGKISAEELKYIQKGTSVEDRENVPTPWKEIFTSLPFWAILIANSGNIWGYWTLLTEISTYMDRILGFKIASNSVLSALPYFVQWILSLIMGPIADYLVVKKITTIRTSRKIFNSIGVFIPTIALVILMFVGPEYKILTVAIFVIAVGFNAAIYSGFNVNHIDIAPVHAGTLYGIGNTAATLCAIVAPLSVDGIAVATGYKETEKPLWNIVFAVAAVIYAVTGIFFDFAAAGEVQPWNNLKTSKEKHTKQAKEQKETITKTLWSTPCTVRSSFTGIIINFGIRAILNVAVISMISEDPPVESIPTYPEWADKKNIMLSSFLWGYVCLQIGAGQIAKNYGPKYFLAGAIFVGSLFTVLVPVFGARFGYQGDIGGDVARFPFPSVHNLLSSWTPIFTRTRIGGLVYAGGPIGNMLAMPITGAISASKAGWPTVFYLFGSIGIAWALAWIILGSNGPSSHRSISKEERDYIEAGQTIEAKKTRTPWKHIFTSMPFLAILVSHCGMNWGYWTLLTEIPSYLEKILGFKIASNSLLSALPYVVQFLLSFLMSNIANIIIERKMVTVGTCRKIFNSIGLFVPAVTLFAMNFVEGDQKQLIIFMLVVAVGFNAGTLNGYNVNHIDISPVHAGTLMGLTNTIANVYSMLTPIAVDGMKSLSGYEETDKSLWNIVFSVASVMYAVAGFFYCVFASGEVQAWDHLGVED
ncbi:hypothetical protein NQ317_013418 [Molorchus minor]|uniref:Major facilitator superfamily (MFS) profile domain-containing protein n=1 Tax=Molorchus minor TaxID=1323400 RepID=A0ABQ9JTS1_9CUCU|nr:hypothetical protein NQ317_013418 [Molorchus minor]